MEADKKRYEFREGFRSKHKSSEKQISSIKTNFFQFVQFKNLEIPRNTRLRKDSRRVKEPTDESSCSGICYRFQFVGY
jgi:hypothetical protein